MSITLTTQQAVSNIPTADSLPLKSQVEKSNAPLPHATATGSERRERDAWMLDPGAISSTSAPIPQRDIPRSAGISTSVSAGLAENDGDERLSEGAANGGADFFSSLGTEHKRKDRDANKPDPTKPVVDHRELNTQLKEGRVLDDYDAPKEKKIQPGGPGSSWRMMKLKRLYEQAEEQ